MLKSCARDHLAKLACASLMRNEMEILQVQTTLSIVLDAPEFISSKTFFRVVSAMWQMHALHLKLFDSRTEIRTKVAKQYFALVSTVLDKQEEIYDLSVVSVAVTEKLIFSLLRVMAQEVHARFLEETPLMYSTSTLEFSGFLTEGYDINARKETELFEILDGNSVPSELQAVMLLLHFKTPFMLEPDVDVVDISTQVLHLQLHWDKSMPLNIKVHLPRSQLLPHSSYDFRRAGNMLPGSLSVYELQVPLHHDALHVQLQLGRAMDQAQPVAAVLLICSDMQSLDAPLYTLRLPPTPAGAEGVLMVPPDTLPAGTYVTVVMDENTYDTRMSRRHQQQQPEDAAGSQYRVSAWWSRCLVWTKTTWATGHCLVGESTWDQTVCRCSSPFTVYGAEVQPLLTEEDTMTVNELMLEQSYDALYFLLLLLFVYAVLAATLVASASRQRNRRNIWLKDNRATHEQAYLLTIKTGTQGNAGTTAKVFAIIHGESGMSPTRELQSRGTGHLFVRGSTTSFIITTEQPLGNILKVQLWHNNRGDECHDSLYSDARDTDSDTMSLQSTDCDTTFDDMTSITSDTVDDYSKTADIATASNSSQLSSSRGGGEEEEDFEEITVENDSTSASELRSHSLLTLPSEYHDSLPSSTSHYSSISSMTNSTRTQTSSGSEISNSLGSSNNRNPDKKKTTTSRSGSPVECCASSLWCGSHAAWFVSEVSVSELLTGAVYSFPCFSWLSVTDEDTRVEREISLETPTTFMQDVEHFLPQFASENVVWTSLVSTSHCVRTYRLQRLTICLIICLGLGTLSLFTVKVMNTSHTMITPDLHLEPLYYGHLLALLLMPVQWLLELAFRVANVMEEKETSIRSAQETINKLKPKRNKFKPHSQTGSRTKYSSTSLTAPNSYGSRSDHSTSISSNLSISTLNTVSVLDENCETWKNLAKWAENIKVDNNPLELRFANIGRRRTNVRTNEFDEAKNSTSQHKQNIIMGSNLSDTSHSNMSAISEVIPTDLNIDEASKPRLSYLTRAMTDNNCDRPTAADTDSSDHCTADSWSDTSDDPSRYTSKLRLLTQVMGWIFCGFFVGLFCLILLVQGIDLPRDYSALWLQIIYITLCTSAIVVQPLIVAIGTVYKVLTYRRYHGFRRSLMSCTTLPLEHTVNIWEQYRAVLSTTEEEHYEDEEAGEPMGDGEAEEPMGDGETEEPVGDGEGYGVDGDNLRRESDKESSLNAFESINKQRVNENIRALRRDRELRFARPPSEDVLLKCRKREYKRQQVDHFLATLLQYTVFLLLLLVIMSNVFITQRYMLNRMLRTSVENGTCFSKADDKYMKFKNISSHSEWWYWAYSQLVDITYNYDEEFSTKSTFCDSNSLLIGTPRIRLYGVPAADCDASHQELSKNKTVTSILGIPYCYPDYVDKVKHPGDFKGKNDKKYEWDAHYLAIEYGLTSSYSYTKHEYSLPDRPFAAFLYLLALNTANWMTNEMSSRALITEFTLYHPPSELFSTVNFIAEFPATSGAQLTITVQSTHIQRYRTGWSYFAMYAEVLMLPAAMYFMVKSALYIYKCKLRIWQSIWGIMDFVFAFLLWTYVVCLMLRVQITEDLLWQLKVSYFQKYVNLKSAMTWDNILDALLGFLIVVHLFRCLRLLNFFSSFRKLGLIFANALRDVLKISAILFISMLIFLILGFQWLHALSYDFHTVFRSFMSVFSLTAAMNNSKLPIYDLPSNSKVFAGIYYVISILFLVMLFRGLYFAAFCYATKTFVYHVRTVEITLSDVFYGFLVHVNNLFTVCRRKKSSTKEQPKISCTNESVPSTLFVAELESQMNSVMHKLDDVCNEMGVEQINEDCYSYSSSSRRSSFSNFSYSRDHFNDLNFIRHSSRSTGSKRTGLSGYDNASFYLHADGFTEVPSCITEVVMARRLVEGMKMVPASMSVSSAHQPQRQKVYDRNATHLTKFLNDVHAASDENISGHQFSKYGKHILKLKHSAASSTSRDSMNSDAENKCSPNTSANELLRNTRTLGHCKNSNDFWQLDYLDLSDEENKK